MRIITIGIGTEKEERFLKKNGIVESYQRDNNDEVVRQN
jgi:Ca-activated chloride channel family protein